MRLPCWRHTWISPADHARCGFLLWVLEREPLPTLRGEQLQLWSLKKCRLPPSRIMDFVNQNNFPLLVIASFSSVRCLPLLLFTSTSKPCPSTNWILPSNRTAAKTRTTSRNGMPSTERHDWKANKWLVLLCAFSKSSKTLLQKQKSAFK